MKKIIATILTSFLILGCTNKKAENYFESMNTFMKVQCYGENAEEANKVAQKYIGELEATISATKPESNLYKANHANGNQVEITQQAADLINFTLDICKKTDGALNCCLYPVTSLWGFTKKQYKVPSDEEIASLMPLTDFNNVKLNGTKIQLLPGMMLDLGAVGKGFAGDEAAKLMKESGIKSALLDLGGNIQTIGKKPDGSDWTIGIKSPFGKSPIGILKINNQAVITSAGYERFFQDENGKKYIHIFDGRTGRPVENEVLSATAICESGTYGDALSTSLFVMGVEKSIDFWKKYNDFDFIIITKDNKLYITKKAAKKFTLNYDDYKDLEVILVK